MMKKFFCFICRSQIDYVDRLRPKKLHLCQKCKDDFFFGFSDEESRITRLIKAMQFAQDNGVADRKSVV